MTALLLLFAVVVAVLVLLIAWTRAFADLLYMFNFDKRLVGAASVATLLAVMVLIHLATGFPVGSPTAFLGGIIIAPLIARPLADRIAYHWAPDAVRSRHRKAKGVIFAVRRHAIDTAYEAPPTIGNGDDAGDV